MKDLTGFMVHMVYGAFGLLILLTMSIFVRFSKIRCKNLSLYLICHLKQKKLLKIEQKAFVPFLVKRRTFLGHPRDVLSGHQ